MHISFNSIKEDKPAEKWKDLFDKTWPHYRRWFLSEGYKARPGYLSSSSELGRHMPEIMPIYNELVTLVGGEDIKARFLSMYCPPAYMSACSQLAYTKGSNTLIRNYDYSLKLFEGTMLYSNWLQPVIGISDCNWGLLDGMNSAGLSASLTFGGRKITGIGFGIPIVIRYILETCTMVSEAVSALSRIPVHMTYNVTLLDKTGAFATVYLSPDRAAIVDYVPIATNHQQYVEWEDYANMTATVHRKQYLEQLLYDDKESEESLIKKFLAPPLYNHNFEKNFGTLYTAAYNVDNGLVKVLWPTKCVAQSFGTFKEERVVFPVAKINRKLTM